ncbi:Uncharacterised protein [Vibrio cholerae]|nr:Uncharacterised protein [Vibrio cholerae]
MRFTAFVHQIQRFLHCLVDAVFRISRDLGWHTHQLLRFKFQIIREGRRTHHGLAHTGGLAC